MTSSSPRLTPVLGTSSEVRAMFVGVIKGLEDLRQDMTKRLDRVEERTQQGLERLRDELTVVKPQARNEKRSGPADLEHQSVPGGELGSSNQGVRRKRH